MFPHVDTEDRNLTANDGILVLGGDDAQAAAGLDEPSPATALDPKEFPRELFLEPVEAAPGLVDLGRQGGRRLGEIGLGGVRWSKVGPEESMVDVSTGVELDDGLQGEMGSDVIVRQDSCVGLQGLVEVGHIGLVMAAVMQLHDLP